MTSDVARIFAEHAYLRGRMFAWWRERRGRWLWREIAPDVFWTSR